MGLGKMPSDIDPRIFFASRRIFSSSLSMKGTTFAVMSRDGTPGYPAPESAWYVATCTSVRSSASARGFSGRARPVIEQFGFVTTKPPSRNAGRYSRSPPGLPQESCSTRPPSREVRSRLADEPKKVRAFRRGGILPLVQRLPDSAMNERSVGVQRLDVSQQGRRIRQEPRGGDREARECRAGRTLQAGEVERALRDAPRERQEAELAQPQEERHRLVVVVQGDVNERHPARTEQLPCFEHRLAVSAIAECDVAARGRPEIRSKQRMDASDPQAGPAHCSKLTLDRRLQAADVEEEGSWFHYRDRAQDLRGDGHRNGDRDNICLLHAFLKIWLERESFGWAGDVIHDDVAPARTEVSAEPLAHASRTADHQDTLVDWRGWDYSRLSAHTLLDQETGETRTER